eukprot:2084611-Amphidinium_carterae.1
MTKADFGAVSCSSDWQDLQGSSARRQDGVSLFSASIARVPFTQQEFRDVCARRETRRNQMRTSNFLRSSNYDGVLWFPEWSWLHSSDLAMDSARLDLE